jgi:hypothetical protein
MAEPFLFHGSVRGTEDQLKACWDDPSTQLVQSVAPLGGALNRVGTLNLTNNPRPIKKKK